MMLLQQRPSAAMAASATQQAATTRRAAVLRPAAAAPRPPSALAAAARRPSLSAAAAPRPSPLATLARRPSPAARAADGDNNNKGAGGDDKPLPPWVRSEREREAAAATGADKGLPWPLYLVLSFLVATAAVGSIFEYANGNAVFGLLDPSSPLWAPVLGLFAFTGLPTAAALFFKGVAAANASFEAQDKADGYIE